MTRIRRRKQPSGAIPFPRLKLPFHMGLHAGGRLVPLSAIALYLGLSYPDLVTTTLLTSAIALTIGSFNHGLQTWLGWSLPLKRWHLVSGAIALSTVISLGAVDPASAQMFNNLENAVTEAVNNTGGTTIAPETITTIFNIFRILIVLAFLIGVVIVFTQATRGGDWQPIANLLAIGIAFVIGVEVISTLIIGGGGTTTTP